MRVIALWRPPSDLIGTSVFSGDRDLARVRCGCRGEAVVQAVTLGSVMTPTVTVWNREG